MKLTLQRITGIILAVLLGILICTTSAKVLFLLHIAQSEVIEVGETSSIPKNTLFAESENEPTISENNRIKMFCSSNLDASGTVNKMGSGEVIRLLECNPIFKSQFLNRGFYLHHIASYMESVNEKSPLLFFKIVANQYGLAGISWAIILLEFGKSFSLSQLAVANLLTGILVLGAYSFWLLRSFGFNLRSFFMLSGMMIAMVLYVIGVNSQQLLLSPGFGLVRYTPAIILGCCQCLRIVYPIKYIKKSRVDMWCIAAISFNSLSFNIVYVASSFIGFLASRPIATHFPLFRLAYLEVIYQRGVADVRARIVVFGLLFSSLQFISERIVSGFGSGRGITDSIMEGQHSLEYIKLIAASFLGIAIIALLSRIYLVFSRMIFGELYCLLILNSGYLVYTAMFWGSPNHALGGMVMTMPSFIGIFSFFLIAGQAIRDPYRYKYRFPVGVKE